MSAYGSNFFERFREGSRRSARAVVPLVLDLVGPRSVVDVGCGMATWLAVFRELGVEDVLGIDGDYVDRGGLEIPVERFVAADLERPPVFDRRFDLVMSLEVAEHLSPEHADAFVDLLTRLGPAVLFSAAIPGQGGVRHLNEQWPEYWAELFRRRGYVPVDCVRPRVWRNPDVEFWYAQNILMFAAETYLATHERLRSELDATRQSQLSVAHPDCYRESIRKRAQHSVPVSVIIPCYKQAHYVGEAIESALSQGYPNLEIVVVDDGSPDDVRAVVDRYRSVRYVRQENRGLSGARNTGIRESTGDFLVFLDSDDLLLPNAIERGVEQLNARPHCAFVAGRMSVIAADGSPLEPWRAYPAFEDKHAQLLINHCDIYPLVVMYRRSAVEAVGGFNTSLRSLEDWDIDLSLAFRHDFHLYNEEIAEYRRHGTNMSSNVAVMMKSHVTMMRRHRRRIRSNRKYAAAYREAVRTRYEWFRQPLLEELRLHLQSRQWSQVARDVAFLMRYDPPLLPEWAMRRLYRLVMRVSRTVPTGG
ncbi:MAG: glycosyltransferase [Chloroflexota bacterium]|nr:glycosyltransferase [Chloroflexota bacterium]